MLEFHGPSSSAGYYYLHEVPRDKDALLYWEPEPMIISVRTHQDNTGPVRFKGVTVVFDNGLFAHLPIGPLGAQRQAQLGKGAIDADGNLRFDDGTNFRPRSVYRDVVRAWCEPLGGDGPRDPVTGEWFQIRN